VDEFDPVRLNAEIGSMEVEPTFPARVVINRSSGVVVMGQNVRIAPVVISFKESELSVGWQRMSEESESSVHLDNTARVKDVVDVLTKAGLRVDDIIDVLQTIERAGALYGTLEVM
jgi:flagellar P-ring protein precursor FlgI